MNDDGALAKARSAADGVARAGRLLEAADTVAAGAITAVTPQAWERYLRGAGWVDYGSNRPILTLRSPDMRAFASVPPAWRNLREEDLRAVARYEQRHPVAVLADVLAVDPSLSADAQTVAANGASVGRLWPDDREDVIVDTPDGGKRAIEVLPSTRPKPKQPPTGEPLCTAT